jgi:Cu(I)/Ag(I) efflux system protein CusF
MKHAFVTILFGLSLIPGPPAMASEHDHGSHATNQGQTTATDWSEGTVKRINTETGKVTLSHGPLVNLDMPAMTMVFRVKDSAWLNQIKPGDRVRFLAEKVDGALTVSKLEVVAP